MKTKLLGKRTVVAALLAAVFLVSAAFFAVFAFRGNRVFAEGTYYTDDVSAMPEIDFSETGLVSDAKSETFDNAGVLQEIWGENAPGMTVDTTMTASFMFESGANTGYVVSFRRSGWSEDLKLNFYPDGKVELFKNRSESQSFNDGAFQAGTWYYVKYTVATLYSDEALETQVGYRSTYTVTDNAEYTFSHSMDFLNEEIGNDESGSAIKYDTGNFFLWVSTELANHVHVASYQYDPSSVPEEPTDPVDPEACYTKDIASLPAIDFSATGLVMDPKADTYNESGLKEFYEGNAPGTTIDTTFTAAIMFEEGAVNTHPISFRRSGWSENLKLNIYSDGKVELYKNDTPADCETFNGTAFTPGTWYYVKYTVANLYSDEGLKNQVGYRSVVTITDNADYNVEYTLSFLNEETNGLDYNTGNFFVWMGTELGGKGYIASYQFDPDAEATTYYPAVDLEDAEVIEISDKIPMNAAGIDIRSDSYFSNDGYYANFTGIYELNKTFRFRIQGKGSFHTAYTGNWIWESYKADFEYDTNSIIFGRGGDDRGDTINPSPALSEDKIYLVEITIIEYLREDNDEKAFEMFVFRLYEDGQETPIVDKQIQYTGPIALPEDGARGYFGIYVGSAETNDLTILPADFSRDYAVTLINGDNSNQVAVSYGDPYDFSDYVQPKQGYDFEGWEYYADGVRNTIPSSGTWTVDFTTQSGGVYEGSLTAVYTPIDYTVNYVITGGTNSDQNPAAINVEDGTVTLSDPTPTNAGEVFFGWYLNAEFTGDAVTQIECTFEEITLYAKIAEGCTLTLIMPDGEELKISAELNVAYVFPTETSEGYGQITGWEMKDGDSWTAVSGASVTPTADATYRAVAEPISYAITYEMDGGTNNSQNPASYTIQDTITLLNPEKDGYFFIGWYMNDDAVKGIVAGTTGNITLEARWVEDTLPESVRYSVSENAVLLPVPSGLPAGSHYNVNLFDAQNNPLQVVSNSYTFAEEGSYKLVYNITLPSGTYTREVQVTVAELAISVSGDYKTSYKAGDVIDIFAATAGDETVSVQITKDGEAVTPENGKLTLEEGTYRIVYSADGAQNVAFEFTVSGADGTNWALWGTLIGVGAVVVIGAVVLVIFLKRKKKA